MKGFDTVRRGEKAGKEEQGLFVELSVVAPRVVGCTKPSSRKPRPKQSPAHESKTSCSYSRMPLNVIYAK